MKILTLMYFSKIKTGKITRGHVFTLVKGQSRLDVGKCCFSQRTVNEFNKLSADCLHSSGSNTFKNSRQLSRKGKTHLDSYMWNLDEPKASLSDSLKPSELLLGWQSC